MTDADVDGSHIRTLLLTFFFRQYPEIIKREIDAPDGTKSILHHLFIAQPPLFKVKRGKKELYLKNEQALEDFLLDSAVEDVRLVSDKGEVMGAALKTLGKRALRYTQVLAQTEKKGDSRIIDAMVRASGLTKDDLVDDKAIAKTLARLTGYFKQHAPDLSGVELEIRKDAEHGGFKVICPTRFGGARKLTTIDYRLLDSPEYDELTRIGTELSVYGPGPFQLVPLDTKDEESAAIQLGRLDHLGEKMEAIGRKGLQISRYKGLGEMNAEQLWETTMDPKSRTLLEVHADDLNTAESVFSTL